LNSGITFLLDRFKVGGIYKTGRFSFLRDPTIPHNHRSRDIVLVLKTEENSSSHVLISFS
jgi:hypothetical protein